MFIGNIVKIFKVHSVSVSGMKGSGKDLLTANVVSRRKNHYVSNIDYTQDERYIKLHFNDLDVGGNTRRDLVNGTVKKYICPYPEDTDIYISDCGVYLPSQYCNELNREYPYIPLYEALSRHFNNGKIHTNCQHIGRVWDKIREMQDIYIYCNWVFKPLVNLGIVIQKVTIYDKYESCASRVKPCRIKQPLLCLNPVARHTIDMYIDNFYNQHGSVKSHILIYINRAKYDTRHFKKLFEEGV